MEELLESYVLSENLDGIDGLLTDRTKFCDFDIILNVQMLDLLIKLCDQYKRDNIFQHFIDQIFFNKRIKILYSHGSIKNTIINIFENDNYRYYWMHHPNLDVCLDTMARVFGHELENYLEDIYQYVLLSEEKIICVFKSLYDTNSYPIIKDAFDRIGYLLNENCAMAMIDQCYFDSEELIELSLDWLIKNNFMDAVSLLLEKKIVCLDIKNIKYFVRHSDVLAQCTIKPVSYYLIKMLDGRSFAFLNVFNEIISILMNAGIIFPKSTNDILEIIEDTIDLLK